MDVSLSGFRWQLKGFWPYVPLLGRSLELGKELMGVTEWMEAKVPGGVHHDLLKAGWIEDPYFEMNSLKCEWVEHRWWVYRTRFTPEAALEGKRYTLIFKGVDYKAHFYLNRVKLGEHEGMYEWAVYDVSETIKPEEENELTVLIENAPQEMAQIGLTSKTMTQKSRFNYKWDFGTRLVNLGIWDDVILKITENAILKDVHLRTDVQGKKGRILLIVDIEGKKPLECTLKTTVSFNGETLTRQEIPIMSKSNFETAQIDILLDNPNLWYPNGAGAQPLYQVRIELWENGRLSDEQAYDTGIRKLSYRQNENSPADALPYTVVINGAAVYVKGVNMTPLDHLYGNVSHKTYEKYVLLLKNAHINMVRIWGGGLIEKEYFYRLCDKHGIMIWQEFIQSSSGIDNIPSTDPHFLSLLKSTAVQAVKTRRNHVSLVIWSGGNELREDDQLDKPATFKNPNIFMLKGIVDKYDKDRLFLPTSASGPREFNDPAYPGQNHDVHGNWQYEGIKMHYSTYNKSDSLFHSEFGVSGCSEVRSLRKFLGDSNLKLDNMKENLVWRHHGEWWDTYFRDKNIFGEFQSLSHFVKASQFIQAEGIRYSLEANRRRKFRNSGSMIWQFNEPWPNVANTCIVDYYAVPKMAYYWLRKAYEPVHASLRYDKLLYQPGENFCGEVFLHNSLQATRYRVLCEMMDVRGDRLLTISRVCEAAENQAGKVHEISLKVPKQENDLFFLRIRVYDMKGTEISSNLYVFSQQEKSVFSNLARIKGGKLEMEMQQGGCHMCNIGSSVCLFIHGLDNKENGSIFIPENYDSLFPGEEKMFQVQMLCTKEKENSIEATSVEWNYFNRPEL